MMEKRLGKPVTGTAMAASGATTAGAASDEGEPRNAKWRCGQERAGAGVVMPGSGASWPARSGQWRRAANVTSMGRLCPGDDQPLCQSIQFVSERDDQPDSEFCREENFMTVDFQQKFRTSKLKPNVPATTLVQ